MMKAFQCAVLLCILISCEKQVNHLKIEPLQNESAKAVTKTYLPLTKGNHWKYNVTTNGTIENSTVKVLGVQKNIRNKTYEMIRVSKDSEKDTIYYNQTGNQYYLYTSSSGAGETTDLELLFLYDNQPVGFQWTGNAGSANGLPARYTGKILQKDISLTVNGTTYKQVIHSQVLVQVRVLFYITASIEDFYVAEGIGIIKNITAVKLGEPSTTTTTITGYRIN